MSRCIDLITEPSAQSIVLQHVNHDMVVITRTIVIIAIIAIVHVLLLIVMR